MILQNLVVPLLLALMPSSDRALSPSAAQGEYAASSSIADEIALRRSGIGQSNHQNLVGPSIYPPSTLETTVVADCDGPTATVTYTVLPRATPDASFRLDSIAIERAGTTFTIPSDQLVLPLAASAVPRPYVERVIASCSVGGAFAFVFYLTPSYLVSLPQYIAQSPVTRLELKISPDNQITMEVKQTD